MPTSHFRTIFVSAFLLLLSSDPGASADDSARPLWVTDPGREFPNELYIAEVGSGDTEEAAKSNVASRIAMVFQSDVMALDEIVNEYWETDAGAVGELAKSTHLREQIAVSTDQKLRNVTFARTWFDRATGRHFALAYLDRAQTTSLYLEELAHLDREATEFFSGFRSHSDKLTRLAFLNKTLSLAAERDLLAGQLLVISQGGSSHESSLKAVRLASARASLRNEISVRIVRDGENRPTFESAVRGVLEGQGFRIVSSGADYEMRAGLTMNRLDRPGKFVGWRAELSLAETASGAELLSCERRGREGHRSFSEAERRAETKARAEVKTALMEAIDGYLGGLLARGD